MHTCAERPWRAKAAACYMWVLVCKRQTPLDNGFDPAAVAGPGEACLPSFCTVLVASGGYIPREPAAYDCMLPICKVTAVARGKAKALGTKLGQMISTIFRWASRGDCVFCINDLYVQSLIVGPSLHVYEIGACWKPCFLRCFKMPCLHHVCFI